MKVMVWAYWYLESAAKLSFPRTRRLVRTARTKIAGARGARF